MSSSNAMNLVIGAVGDFFYIRKDQQPPPDEAQWRADLIAALTMAIESFPREYEFRIYLPQLTAFGPKRFPLSADCALVIDGPSPDAVEKQPFGGAYNTLANLLSGIPTPHTRGAYISCTGKGYLDTSFDSSLAEEMKSRVKQVAFVLKSYDVIKLEGFGEGSADAVYIDEGKELKAELPRSLARYAYKLQVKKEKLEVYETVPNARSLLDSIKSRPAETPEENSQGLERLLASTRNFFEASTHPDWKTIAAAIDWYQDATLAENDTFAYIANCIGLEALFGPEQQISEMSERLCDRYAYMLGTSRQERKELHDQYRKVLKLRGQLVHGRQARLNDDDQRVLHTARNLLYRAIWHELMAVYKAIEQGKDKEKAAATPQRGLNG